MTIITVEIPNTDPRTGPETQVGLRGAGGEADAVGVEIDSAVAAAVGFTTAEGFEEVAEDELV
jgi:hypothetical protein